MKPQIRDYLRRLANCYRTEIQVLEREVFAYEWHYGYVTAMEEHNIITYAEAEELYVKIQKLARIKEATV